MVVSTLFTKIAQFPNSKERAHLLGIQIDTFSSIVAIAKNLLQNILLLPENSPKETLHSALLRLMSPKTRSLVRDSESRVSQPSNSSSKLINYKFMTVKNHINLILSSYD
jgi:hypothetical protein